MRARSSRISFALALGALACGGSAASVGCGGADSAQLGGGDGGGEAGEPDGSPTDGTTGDSSDMGADASVDAHPGTDGGGADGGKEGGKEGGTDGGKDGGHPGKDGGADSGGGVDGGGKDSGSTGDANDTDASGGNDASGTDAGSGNDAAGGNEGGPVDAGPDAVVCGPPKAGLLYVSPTGSDSTGNGSLGCPFVTIAKALSLTTAATGVTTILLVAGTSGSPNVYGAGCTAGGTSCDATPIHVTDAMSHGILIRSVSGGSAGTVVAGGVAATDTSVFLVNAPNVGFAGLTIAPRRVATGAGAARKPGAIGIELAAPAVASGTEAEITDVVVDGVVKSTSTESTGSGISISGGTSPTVGPHVTIVGGDHGVLVTQAQGNGVAASSPTITSNTGAETFIHSTQFACIRVETTNATATTTPTAIITSSATTDPGRLHLQDCGGNGGVVVDTVRAGKAVTVSNTLIDTSGPTAAAYYGIRLQNAGVLAASDAVTITGINEPSVGVGAGIEAVDTSRLTISPPTGTGGGVVVGRCTATGVHIGGSANASLDTLDSENNRNGLVCDASGGVLTSNLTLRNSTLLGNGTYGAYITGAAGGASCNADLGSTLAAGNNVYNNASTPNGQVGLCYMATGFARASSSTWSCGLAAGAACTPATATTPTPVAVSNCQSVGDYNTSLQLTVALPQTCCGM